MGLAEMSVPFMFTYGTGDWYLFHLRGLFVWHHFLNLFDSTTTRGRW